MLANVPQLSSETAPSPWGNWQLNPTVLVSPILKLQDFYAINMVSDLRADYTEAALIYNYAHKSMARIALMCFYIC